MKANPVAAAIGALLMAMAGHAVACSPAPNHDVSVEAAVARSDQIFVAQVIKAELLPPGSPRMGEVVVTYRLQQALKGAPPVVGVVVNSIGNCGARLTVGSQALFFVDLQRTRYGIPQVDGIPTGSGEYSELAGPSRRLMAELQTALHPQHSTPQATP